MKISSWNVNSVRARIINIISYLKFSNPDILLIQEIKTEEKNFPYDDFKNIGYKSYVFGQKSYNGVAFLSKVNINKIDINFIKDKKKQSRIISGEFKKKSKTIKLINIYVPNGNPINTEKYDYKKNWYNAFNKNDQEYTFWDYMAGSWQKNHGMRIDHFLISNNLLSDIKGINIDKKQRSKLKPSDHTPIEMVIN